MSITIYAQIQSDLWVKISYENKIVPKNPGEYWNHNKPDWKRQQIRSNNYYSI